jgi:hypothetical protein
MEPAFLRAGAAAKCSSRVSRAELVAESAERFACRGEPDLAARCSCCSSPNCANLAMPEKEME